MPSGGARALSEPSREDARQRSGSRLDLSEGAPRGDPIGGCLGNLLPYATRVARELFHDSRMRCSQPRLRI